MLSGGPSKEAIERLLVMKTRRMESKHGPDMPKINTFITTKLAQLEKLTDQQEKRTANVETLNRLFQEMVEGITGGTWQISL